MARQVTNIFFFALQSSRATYGTSTVLRGRGTASNSEFVVSTMHIPYLLCLSANAHRKRAATTRTALRSKPSPTPSPLPRVVGSRGPLTKSPTHLRSHLNNIKNTCVPQNRCGEDFTRYPTLHRPTIYLDFGAHQERQKRISMHTQDTSRRGGDSARNYSHSCPLGFANCHEFSRSG